MTKQRSAIIRRHQNVFGIALRGLTFCVLFWALWERALLVVAICLLVETCNWIFMPEVETPPKAIDAVIDMELRWLHAPTSSLKAFSWMTLFLGVAAIAFGLVLHDYLILACAASLLLAFLVLMKFGPWAPCDDAATSGWQSDNCDTPTAVSYDRRT